MSGIDPFNDFSKVLVKSYAELLAISIVLSEARWAINDSLSIFPTLPNVKYFWKNLKVFFLRSIQIWLQKCFNLSLFSLRT